jgi:hypothetical protein
LGQPRLTSETDSIVSFFFRVVFGTGDYWFSRGVVRENAEMRSLRRVAERIAGSSGTGLRPVFQLQSLGLTSRPPQKGQSTVPASRTVLVTLELWPFGPFPHAAPSCRPVIIPGDIPDRG